MNAKQDAHYDMFEQVEKCLGDNRSTIDSITALRRHANRFNQVVQSIGVASGRRQAIGNSGGAKMSAREVLADNLESAGNVIAAWASETGNERVGSIVKHTHSSFIRMRDSDLKITAGVYQQLVTEHASGLEPYGFTADMKTALDAAAGAFNEMKSATRSGVNDRKMATQQVATLFTTANKLLHEQIDRLVRAQKKNHPEFVAAYEAARIIVDVARRSRPATEA
ncbi:hypothetical protein EPD60_13985 [Flaviaesturariibacter flavus]|uniref:Uncharacterized protein n=1 Tax=Flaviaesturariibacter flavus TaxID=2502780 RepID=A0A4R1B4I4_9BACT|nr:hypothetical protein [Flaviaesturariibacter flavus]TCJ13012.1 hypothetical protein EPD60_13985 [Flaviaesturariibacter flavus]